MDASHPSIILRCRNLHLSYGQTDALRGVDFDLAQGEIHALVGEHRAGKSSLIKILSGAERCRQGDIIYKGRRIPYFTPASAARQGIAIVYQELTIVQSLNAVENIFNGHMLRMQSGILAYPQMLRRTRDTLAELDFDLDCQVPLESLSRSKQHLVEFARAYALNPQVLLLDEISNKLTPEEMQRIYQIIWKMKQRGVAVVYISHNIDEILRISDRITILKEGRRRDTEYTRNLDKFKLYQLTYSFSIEKHQIETGQIESYLFLTYLEKIINNLEAGFVLLDFTRAIRLTNFTANDLLGVKADKPGESDLEWLLDSFSGEDRAPISRAIRESLYLRRENVRIRSGKAITIQIIPIVDPPGKGIATALLLEETAISQELADYFIESEKMASVASVAVGIAHEINNPLAIIKNYVEIIRDSGTSEDVEGSIQKVEVELNRIVDIVSSLLSFSRVKQIPRSLVNLNRQIGEVLPLVNHLLLSKNIIVRVSLPKSDVYVHCTENKVKQILLNMLNNSIEALLDHGQIWIDLQGDEKQKKASITVRDDGYGIADEVKDRVFNPFFTTKMTGKNTGLGLTICRHIIEAYGGTIDFTSDPGSYTSFRITFPLP